MTDTTNVQNSALNLRKLWVIFLSGPVIWVIHFMLIYALAEFGCSTALRTLLVGDLNGVIIAIIVLTLIVLIILIYISIFAYKIRSDDNLLEHGTTYQFKHFMGDAGWIMSILFTVVILVTVIPVVWFSSCATLNIFNGTGI